MRNPSKNTLKTLFRVNNQSPVPGWAMRKADYYLFNEVGARAYTMSKGKICNRQPKGYERYLTPNCKTIYQNSKLIMYLSLEFIEPTFESSFKAHLCGDAYNYFATRALNHEFSLTKLTHVATKRIEADKFECSDYHELNNLATYIDVKLVTDNGYTVRAVGGHWQLQVGTDVWLNFYSLEVANTYIPTGLEKEQANHWRFIDKPINFAQQIESLMNSPSLEASNVQSIEDRERTAYMKVEEPTYFYISLEHDSRQMRTSLATIIKDLKTLKDEA